MRRPRVGGRRTPVGPAPSEPRAEQAGSNGDHHQRRTTESPAKTPPAARRPDLRRASPWPPGLRSWWPWRGVSIFLAIEGVPRALGRRAGHPTARRRRTSGATSGRWSSAPSWPRCSPWSSPCRSRSASRCSSPTTRPRRLAGPSPTSSTCSPPSPSSSSASGASRVLAPASSRRYAWLDDNLGLLPFFAGPGVGHRPHDAHRRHRARRHDPADHHRDLAARSSRRRRGCTRRPRWPSAPPAGR